jgi:hypothetical protein
MLRLKLKCTSFIVAVSMIGSSAIADGHSVNYGPFPITLKSYSGEKNNSVSYTGQIARHVLHDSLKVLAGQGNGGENSTALEKEMLSYFSGSEKNKAIIAPGSKGEFVIKQTTLNEISSGQKY